MAGNRRGGVGQKGTAARREASRVTTGADKRLNGMDRLGDMAHFPALVNAGATANVLVTMAVTWWVAVRFPGPLTPLAWIGLVLVVNLAPVVLLRRTITPATPFPTLREMDFVRDQHKFSDWVYLAASANMAFWVLLTLCVSRWRHEAGLLIGLLAVAAVVTFSPVLMRGLRRTP